jgi:chaperone BCS1
LHIFCSNIINILDGVLYKHGSIIFITTNHPEKLDNALIRIGRIDMIINFDYPKKEEIRTMFNDILHNKNNNTKSDFDIFYKAISGSKIPMSALIGFLFRYRDNWKDNISELIETNSFIKKVVNGENNESEMYS